MNRYICTTAILAALSAGPAAASGFEGGTAKLAYYEVGGGDYHTTQLAGSVVFGLSGSLSLQGDILSSKYSDASDSITDIGVHLIYAMSSTTAVGAFYNNEDYGGTTYNQLGVEGKASLSGGSTPFVVSGYLSSEDSPDTPFTFDYAGVGISADIAPQITLAGAYNTVSNATSLNALTVAGRFHANRGLYAELNYTSISGDASTHTVGIEVGIDFGNGATFEPRTYVSNLKGY